MARTKSIHAVVSYTGTPYIINDLGANKSPRFELLDKTTMKVIEKSDNPIDFDKIVFGVNKNAEFSEEPKKRRGRPRKSAE